jgi:hypothetical protein
VPARLTERWGRLSLIKAAVPMDYAASWRKLRSPVVFRFVPRRCIV